MVETPHIEGRTVQNPSTSGLVADTLVREFPEIEYGTSLRQSGELLLSVEETDFKTEGLFASEEFFDVFSFDLIQGGKKTVLDSKNSIVISKDLATRFFGDTSNVIGKVVQLDGKGPLTVTGLLDNVPANSSIKFDFILSYEFFKEINPNVLDWSYNTVNAY